MDKLTRIQAEQAEHDRLLIEAAKEWGLSIANLISTLIDLEMYVGIITVEDIKKLHERTSQYYPEESME